MATTGDADARGVAGSWRLDRATGAVVARTLAPAGVYLAVRAVGVLVLAVMAGHAGTNVTERLTAWDGGWLLAIARHGYAGVPSDMLDAFGGHTPTTPYGFFPGYPAAVAAVGWVTGGDLVAAGLAVSAVAGVVAAYALVELGALVPGGSRRAGLLLVALVAAAPMGIALSMTYTEALFGACAAWALVAVLREQWLVAGTCTLGAGLVRPVGDAVVAAVVLAAAVAIGRRRAGWRAGVGGLLAVVGLFGYLGVVAVRTGRPDGWFRIQRDGWGWYVDGGAATARAAAGVLRDGDHLFDVITLLALVGSLTLFVVAVATRLPGPLLAYGLVVLLTVWGTSGPATTKVRLLDAAFVLLVPVAVGLARRRAVTTVVTVGAAALASAWFGGYALTIWPYGI